MSKFYIYHHLRNDTGQPFYVGKGHGRRAWDKNHTKHWKNIVAKHGYVIEIVIDGITEAEAFDCERMLIADYRAAGHKLANKTDGGEGVTGFKFIGNAKRNQVEAIRKVTQTAEWRVKNLESNRKLAQDPQWLFKNATMITKRSQDPTWRRNVVEGARKRSQDPEWQRKNAEKNRKLAQDPDWRRKRSEIMKASWAKRKGQDNE